MPSSLSLGSALLLALASLYSLLTLTNAESSSACFSPANRTLDLDCGTGYMLLVRRTFYGYSPSRTCRLLPGEEGGCTVDEHNTHYACVGQQTCSINLPTGDWGVAVPGCGRRSNYFQVEYTCVAADTVPDICSSHQLTADSGFLMTPNYPSNFHHQGKCTATVHAHPSQKLTLYIIDMDLRQAERTADCDDFLYFNDKLRSITLCGSRSNNTYHMHSNQLHIELVATSEGRSKGFWLYYEAWPPLPTSLEPPTPTLTQASEIEGTNTPADLVNAGEVKAAGLLQSQDTDQHVTNAPWHPRSTVPLTRTSSSSSSRTTDSLPFAAIAGGVIGTLSVILLVLLLLLLGRWLRERSYNKVEKVLEIRNPAFRSSADFHAENMKNSSSSAFSKSCSDYDVEALKKQNQQSCSFNDGYYC